MEKQTVLSRKTFIRIITVLTTGVFLWLWHLLSAEDGRQGELQEFRHGGDIPQGVNYFNKYYIYRKGDSIRAFSTKCTHAGCRLGKTNGGILQCGCHGSRFDAATGHPVQGPAILPLNQLECKFETSSREWIVRFQKRTDDQA